MYSFLRETDYVSGALLTTPRILFESLGGLDPAYGFGFYEDTDYCFRVRQAGRRVLYQPESTIIHVEDISLPRPRDLVALRADPEFTDLWERLWRLLEPQLTT